MLALVIDENKISFTYLLSISTCLFCLSDEYKKEKKAKKRISRDILYREEIEVDKIQLDSECPFSRASLHYVVSHFSRVVDLICIYMVDISYVQLVQFKVNSTVTVVHCLGTGTSGKEHFDKSYYLYLSTLKSDLGRNIGNFHEMERILALKLSKYSCMLLESRLL